MGACIFCGKSAGPFYSLHKRCYAKYNDSEQQITALLTEGLESVNCLDLANNIQQHISDFGFLPEAQMRTMNRALEYYASEYLEPAQFTSSKVQAWIDLLVELAPDESIFIQPHFMAQQYNLHALMQLNNGQLPECNRHHANYSIQLRDQEELWWCFDEGEIQQDKPPENKQQWSVVMHLVESIVKKQTSSLIRDPLGHGKLLVTNQRIFFDGAGLKDEIEHHQVYSFTPIKNGVRVQPRQTGAHVQSYLCEDARLLFGLIKFAQKTTAVF